MPLPANFSNFGKSGNTAALNSRNDNFASFTPPPKPAPAPAPAPAPSPIPTPTPPPSTPADFSDNSKDIPPDGDCEVICDSYGEDCYCPTGGEGDSAGDGSATQDDVDNAIEEGQSQVNEIVEISQDAAKYLQMAEAGTSLLRVANAALNGMGLEGEANSVTTQANQLQIDSMRLQANVNSGLNTLNQGINNRNIDQIQSGFNKLEAAKIEASQLQTRGQDVVRQAQALESRVQKFQATDTRLQMIGQGLGYGAQASTIAGQSYQAFNQPTPENIGAVGATTAQTGLRLLSEATSFVSPIGAQFGSGAIEAARNIGVQAGQGRSTEDVALSATSFFGGAAYNYAKQANYYAGQGNEPMAAQYATFAAIDVASTAAMFTPASPVVMPAKALAMGFTAFGASLAQGATFETASVTGADVLFTNLPVGKILNASNLITGAKQGETGWFNATQPVTGTIRTIEAPLASTTLPRSTQDNPRLGWRYQPSLGAQFRSENALAQQIQPTGTTFDQTSLAIASAKQAAIRAKYGIDAVNFSAKE